MDKPKILLYWGYHRKAWISPFERLKAHFDFQLLFFVFPEEERESFTDIPKHYWSDFTTAQDVLGNLEPTKVVFMGISAPNTMALNSACKKSGIPTYVMQHGLFHSYEKYERLQEEQDRRRKETGMDALEAAHPDLHSFLRSFFVKSVSPTDFTLIRTLWKIRQNKKKMNPFRALAKAQSESRLADHYLVYTKFNADLYRKCDGVEDDRMIEIGNSEMDDFEDFEPKEEPKQPYYVLVDQSFAEIKDFNSPGYGPKKEEVLKFYYLLSEYCASKGALLKVKLHPYSYSSEWFVETENLRFIKDANVLDLLMYSEGVFGFFSSLMVPAVVHKPTVIFRMFEESDFINEVEACSLAQVLDYHSFELTQINFRKEKPAEGMERFTKKYLFKKDGKSLERLKMILHG